MSWGWLWSGMGVCIQARARRGGVAFGFDCAKQMIKMQTKKINRENTSDGTVQDSYCERREGGGLLIMLLCFVGGERVDA